MFEIILLHLINGMSKVDRYVDYIKNQKLYITARLQEDKTFFAVLVVL